MKSMRDVLDHRLVVEYYLPVTSLRVEKKIDDASV
jgi:hypothetical protein